MRRPRGEDGAYAILYALLLLVVLGTAAIVVDLAAMREDRRQSRLASDSAAVAGARALDPLGTLDPEQACEDAWSYVVTNMDVDPPSSTGCAGFAGLSCDTTAEHTVTATSDGVTVTVTWPVPQTSTLLTQPNVQPADDTVSQQTVDTEIDGDFSDACSRIGVTIKQVHEQFLAGIFGASDTETTVTSVARAITVPGEDQAIAALNVLNETTCQAIVTSGQGFILVNDVDDRPGIISVESSGRDSNGVCPNNRPWVIDGADNSSGAYIRADSPDGDGLGIIYSYALNASPTGNPTQAYDPSLVPPSNTLLRPKPTLLSQRVGDSPVRDIYDCTSPCDEFPESYVDTLKTRLQTGTPQPYEHHESPYDTLAFTTLSGGSCNIGVNDVLLLPAANYYFDCNTVSVNGRLFVMGGTMVTKGGINVGAQGCFAMNVPFLAAPASCAGLVVNGDTVPSPTKGAILYMRDGDFEKDGQASIIMPRTFVYMNDDSLDFAAGSGTLFWTNPRQSDTACDEFDDGPEEECNASRFSKVALWSESNDTQELGGQATLTVRGVVFTPEAQFHYSGQPLQNQTNAQFWADTLSVTGQSGLTMAPDPTDAVASPSLGVVLIR